MVGAPIPPERKLPAHRMITSHPLWSNADSTPLVSLCKFRLGERGNAEIDSARRRCAPAWIRDSGELLDRPERTARVLLAPRRRLRMHVEWQQEVL